MIALAKGNTLGAIFHRGMIIAGALVSALALQAGDEESHKSTKHTSLTGGDAASCIKEAAQMNAATIKFAQLASEKAESSELKQFSAKLEKDHTKAQEKLETIAKKHNVTLPTSLDAKCQEELTRLKAFSGEEFDKEFAKGALQGHAAAINKLREASVQVTDTDVSQYAKDMLAQVKEHQEKAREVAKSVGIDQTTIASLERQAAQDVGTPGESVTERGSSSGEGHQEAPDRDTPDQP